MELNEYQRLALQTVNPKLNRMEMKLHALHEISAEVGEIHSIFQKAYQGHPVNTEDLKLEIGDLMWGICELCNVFGFTLEGVANANINKLRNRYPEGFSESRSINRTGEFI